MVLEKLPPYDSDAENSTIAACMVDDAALARVGAVVEPRDFLGESNALIFGAMLRLSEQGRPTSPILVADELRRAGQLEAVGGLSFLTGLTTDLPTAVGVEFYAAIVRRCAIHRRLIRAAGQIAQTSFEGTDDPRAAVVKALAEIQRAAGPRDLGEWESASAVLEREWSSILGELEDPANARGISTGWPSLDRLLYCGGLVPGLLYTWLAQTSIGKSTVGRTLLRNVALAGHGCALFTLEQGKRVTVEQILFGMAGIDAHSHRAAQPPTPLSDSERAQLYAQRERFRSHLHRLHLDDSAGITPSQVRLRLAQLQTEADIRVVAIDYLHRMRPDRQRRGGTAAEELSEIAQSLAETAKELGLAIVLFAQINRDNLDAGRAKDEYRPTIGDLHGSSDVEKFSFGILGIHRRQWYVDKGRLPPKPGFEMDLEINVLKQQTGPGVGRAILCFDGARAQVSDPGSESLAW